MKFPTYTLCLVLGLVSLASANAVPSEDGITLPREIACAPKGEMCAGPARIQCCEGLECANIQLVPDGYGNCDIPHCAPRGEMCAGLAGIQCCNGLNCTNIEPVADGAGTCDIPHCSKMGKPCGGITGIQCCLGLKCVGIPPKIEDGIRTRKYCRRDL
ncbi:hypothetical protein L211DRAFT_843082 [Terfezia boudieri ATCC MYA-4762]|uniref:Uncharacterized protein n=1 Tax=Terfezia boudieri ATCC MYA-4762 TaxID=1051890 RepID=A0A3N4L802_9PEZI|nr:hypothetical protein L211DRAFT_843082 [Terfezia boudieri ATCC MYA-4762]